MSMYKTIFVTEETDLQSGEQVFTINGEVSLYGESAFSSLDEAVSKIAGVDANAVVVKVASGKYDSYVVINDGVAGKETAVSEVVAVNFGGGTVSTANGEMTVAPAAFSAAEQANLINELNTSALGSGKVYVANAADADYEVYVNQANADYVAGSGVAVASGKTTSDLATLITGNNTAAAAAPAEEVVAETGKTIFVSADYTDADNVTKFTNFEEAVAAAQNDTSITRIEIASDLTQTTVNAPDEAYNITQNLVIGTDGGNYTISLPGGTAFSIYQMSSNSSIKVEEKLTINGVDIWANGFATSGNDLTIDGTISAMSLKQWTSNGSINITKTAKVTLGDGDGQFDLAYGNGTVNVEGAFEAGTDWSKLTRSDAQFQAGYSGTRGNGNTLNLKNTYMEAGRDFTFNGSNGTVNMDNAMLNSYGGDFAGKIALNQTGNVINLKNNSQLSAANISVATGNTINAADSILKATTLTNNGTVTVSGESTLNIGTLTGSGDIELLKGAILKDSTVNGDASIVGEITFRGDNTFNNIYDFGTYYADSYNGANAEWTVEKGASLTLNHTVGNAYGLGYGDKATINGSLENAREVDRSTLTVDDASFFARKGIRLSTSAGNDSAEGSSFTVNDAYVVIGTDGSFSNSKTAGKFTLDFNNSVVDAAQIFFSESNDKINLSFADSDVKTGIFMTEDKDSVYTLENTKLVTTATGNDRYNGNGGTLNITDSEVTIEQGTYTNKGSLNLDGSTFTAGTVTNSDTITVAGDSTLNIGTLTGNAVQALDGATLTDTTIGGTLFIMKEATLAGNNSFSTLNLYGKEEADLTVADGAVVTITNDLCARDGSNLTIYGSLTAQALSMGGTITVDGGSLNGYAEDYHADVTAQLNIINGGSVTLTNAYKNISVDIDTESTLTLTGTAYKAFDITVQAYTGTDDIHAKIVDVVNDKASIDFSAALANNENLVVIGNDLYYSTLDFNQFTVDASFTGEEVGYGLTKFASADAAFEAVTANGAVEKIVFNGENLLSSTASKYYFYTEEDITFSAGTEGAVVDVSSANRFYFMDTTAANGTPAADADFSNIATVTIDEGMTLKGYINLGQAIDNGDDVDENGNVTRDGGAVNLVVNGTLDHKNLYVASGSTLTVSETGKVTNYASSGDNHIRANGKVVVNGNGADGDMQFASNWWSIRGGEMEFNNTNAKTGTLCLNADADNAVVLGDTTASLKVTDSKLESYSIEVNNSDSSFTAENSEVKVSDLLQNFGTMEISGSAISANRINNSGEFTVTGDSTLKVTGTVTNAGTINVFDSTLEDLKISGSGEDAYIRAENAVLSNLTVSGQETYTVNTDFNGGTYTGKVYTGYGLVDGEWARVTDSETTVTGTVDASSVYWQNYGKLTIAEGAELKTSYFSEGSRQVLTVDGTISAGTFRGYNGVVSETGKINAQAAVQFYGNPDTKRQYDVNGEIVVTHDIAYAHNIVVGFDTAKQWYGDGPNDYWNIGGANTEVNISGEKAKLQIAQGKAGKGTAIIHVDEEGVKATLNISDKAQFLVDGKVINNGNLNIADNAVAVITGNVTNSGSITVDASSSFSAGSIVNNGTFNSENAGEMIVLGDITVTGNVETDDLVVKAGAALSAGSITVNNLTLEIGGSLTLTGTGSEVKTFTVTGELNPENAEFTLVTSGWDYTFADSINFGGVTYTWNGTEGKYLDGTSLEQGEFYFTVQDGALYVAKQTAEIGGIYIGNIDNMTDGDKITVDGVTYTVGKDAFASVEDALAVVTDTASVTAVSLGSGDHMSDVAANFANIVTINVKEGAVVEDATASVFNGDLVINNDGHLDADVTAADEMKIVNTSVNTLLGSYTTDVEITVDNAGGMIGDAAAAATQFNTGILTVNGGDAVNVEVNADQLLLNNTNSFGVNADSGLFAGSIWGAAGTVMLDGSANMSIDGDTVTDVYINADAAHTGTLTFNGNQTFNGSVSAANMVIADGMVVTLKDADFSSLVISEGATLNANPDSMNSFTEAGAISGKGTFNATHTGDWVVNDSVSRNFSGFTGMVSMGDANASIVLGKGDIVNGAAAKESYFSDNATVTVDGNQSVVLAGDGVNTGIDFKGTGVLNVGDYDDKDQSENFNQTLSGDNTGFTGTVNVEEGAVLKIESAINASKINLNAEAVQSAENTSDELLDTQLVLNSNDLNLSAKITGDADDIIAVNANATLSGAEALNDFVGTVNVADNKAVTLNGVNTTSAEFTGSSTAELNVNANNTLTADNTDFVGTVNIGAASTLTLQGDLSTDEKGKINFTAKTSKLDLTADETAEVITIGSKLDNSALASGFLSNVVNVNSNAELTAEGALDAYRGKLDIDADTTLTLSGNNTTQTNIQGNGTLALADGTDVIELTLRNDRLISGTPAGNSLMSFNGTFAVNDNKLNILTCTQTGASITGTGDAELNISKYTVAETGKSYQGSLTLTAAKALDGFNGSINLTESELNLSAVNTTNAVVTGDVKSTVNISDVLTLNTADAVSGFNGTINLYYADDKLTLIGTNTTAATLTGAGVVDADANQKFTGDVTGFTGKFDIAAGKEVQLTGTFADADNKVVNAFGGTLTLADKAVEVQVNGGTGLNTLNFGNNTLTLGTGLFDNVNGTGSVVFANTHTDNIFTSLVAKDVTLTGGRNIEATTFDGNLNITISVADDDTADLTTDSIFGDTINVTITDSALLTGNDYNVIKAGSYGINSIELTIGSETKTLKLNDSVKLDGFTYSLRNKAGVWVIDQRAGASNIVVVNAIWTADPFAAVNDNGLDRVIGFNAAKNLDNAVEYIRGWDVGQGWDNGNLQTGDAKIELTAGKYSLTDGKYLMTAGNDGNGVTQLTISERNGEVATLSGVLRGSDGSKATTLTVEGVRIQATEFYAGGNLVIANTAADKSAGNVIAAGIGNTTANSVIMENASSLTLNGGYFSNRILVGGSVVNASGATVTVDGDTSVVLDNNSGETMTITSNIYGGSWAAVGTVVQYGDASITVNVDEAINLRGNIYVSGGASAQGTLTMNGNSMITFTGDASKLTFTGSVNATQSANDEIVVFDDFSGTFNGSLNGFDTITISGDTNLELGRRQTKTGETGLKFVVDDTTVTSDGAMYIVRDKNRWEFAESITIDASAAVTGTYTLVDNYAAGFDGFAIAIGDVTCSVNQSIVTTSAKYTLNYENNKLTLKVDTSAGYTGNKINTTEDLQLVVDANTSLEGGITARSTAEVAVKIAENATVEIGKTASGASEGIMLYNGSSASIEVAENADLTIYGNITSVNRSESGDNSLVIGKNAEVTVRSGADCDVSFGLGTDTIQLGEGSSLKVTNDTNEKNSSISGSGAPFSDVLKMEKGSSIEAGQVNGFYIEMNVDSVLKMSNQYGNTEGNINVVGVTELVLNPSTEAVAGAKGIYSNFFYENSTSTPLVAEVDSVDMVLGVAQQIAGNTTPEDNTDNVWASLSRIDSDLVVAWGRTQEEVTKALEAFGNDSSLIYGGADFGKSLVADAASLATDGVSAADFDEKKNNGQLA